MTGKCQQELGDADAAEKLYDSAISKDPDQLTAWQGKARLCEQVMDKAAASTNGEARAKLSACYGKLAGHHSEKEGDMGKYHAVQEKHWRMWEKAEDFEKASLPDGVQIFRLYVLGPLGFWTMAPLS